MRHPVYPSPDGEPAGRIPAAMGEFPPAAPAFPAWPWRYPAPALWGSSKTPSHPICTGGRTAAPLLSSRSRSGNRWNSPGRRGAQLTASCMFSFILRTFPQLLSAYCGWADGRGSGFRRRRSRCTPTPFSQASRSGFSPSPPDRTGIDIPQTGTRWKC